MTHRITQTYHQTLPSSNLGMQKRLLFPSIFDKCCWIHSFRDSFDSFNTKTSSKSARSAKKSSALAIPLPSVGEPVKSDVPWLNPPTHDFVIILYGQQQHTDTRIWQDGYLPRQIVSDHRVFLVWRLDYFHELSNPMTSFVKGKY